jgi:hypothetical protein
MKAIKIDPVALIITVLLIIILINLHRLIEKTDAGIARQEEINNIFQDTPWKIINGKVCAVGAFYQRAVKDTQNNVFDVTVFP